MLTRVAHAPPSPARARPATRPTVRVAAVQHRWVPDPVELRASLAAAVAEAATHGAELVCLAELTMSKYFASDPRGAQAVGVIAEPLPGGPTHSFVAELAAANGVHIQASLYERTGEFALGFNTSICVAPSGALVARTRKAHLPVTTGYHEDRYFTHGDMATPVHEVANMRAGFPTCWDEWFPELARAYALERADLLVYPTAIGSEPDFPQFDTAPLWRSVIVGHAIANGLFIVVPNRCGTEPGEPDMEFYGSSFIVDPYGRILVEAPRDEPCVLVAELDLDARRDWLELFPFFETRRPDLYGALVDEGDPPA